MKKNEKINTHNTPHTPTSHTHITHPHHTPHHTLTFIHLHHIVASHQELQASEAMGSTRTNKNMSVVPLL